MPFLSFIARIFITTILQPGVQDVISDVGKYAARQATRAVLRRVVSATAPRKSGGVPTVR